MSNKPLIVINEIPRWSYAQWFILGFYKLYEQGEIDFKIRASLMYKLSQILPINSRKAYYIVYGIHHLLGKFLSSEKDGYCIKGYVVKNGEKKKFCIDTADSPYCFDGEQLDIVNVYFKCQCPITINYNGFHLNEKVLLSYSSFKHKRSLKNITAIGERTPLNLKNKINKIHPLMIGPRHLSWGNSKKSLEKGYQSFISAFDICKRNHIMCYFGSNQSPTPLTPKDWCDIDNEYDLMGYYGKLLSHPNVKRGKAAEILNELGDGYDGRVIKYIDPSNNKIKDNSNLHVPLEVFNKHVAKYRYNLNISGFRLSIPNRFIESFMVGTAIVTDTLSVKWYLPWDEEVIETVRMGYEDFNSVDWQKFKEDIVNLPKTDPKIIKHRFEEKWAPPVVCRYILDTVIKSN